MFEWLHISDIHLNKMGAETRRMRQKLIPFLKENNIKCKYLFVTGDLRYAPEGHFSTETVKFLDELSGAIGVVKKNVFIVPGNHDVNRDNKKRSDAIEAIWEDIDTYYNPKVGIIKEAELYGLQAGNDDFISIMEAIKARS